MFHVRNMYEALLLSNHIYKCEQKKPYILNGITGNKYYTYNLSKHWNVINEIVGFINSR